MSEYQTNLLTSLLADEQSTDMTLVANDGSSIGVHWAIMQTKCKILKQSTTSASSNRTFRVFAKNAQSLKLLQAFCYLGTCDLTPETVVDALFISEQLSFSELQKTAFESISTPGKLLTPSNALLLLDELALRTNDPSVPTASELCRTLASKILKYIQENASQVFLSTTSPSTLLSIRSITITAILQLPWLCSSESTIFKFLNLYSSTMISNKKLLTSVPNTTNEETIKELYLLIDLPVVPARSLITNKNEFIPKEKYIEALEHIASPLTHPILIKHRDHGRLAIGHLLGGYPGYQLVSNLQEFLSLLPELVSQHDFEGCGLPILARFKVSRMALGIGDGILACGFDPTVIVVRSATVDFGSIGEHSGPFATLALSGETILPNNWPNSAGRWSVNPTILRTALTDQDHNDRPGLFCRISTEKQVLAPSTSSAELITTSSSHSSLLIPTANTSESQPPTASLV